MVQKVNMVTQEMAQNGFKKVYENWLKRHHKVVENNGNYFNGWKCANELDHHQCIARNDFVQRVVYNEAICTMLDITNIVTLPRPPVLHTPLLSLESLNINHFVWKFVE